MTRGRKPRPMTEPCVACDASGHVASSFMSACEPCAGTGVQRRRCPQCWSWRATSMYLSNLGQIVKRCSVCRETYKNWEKKSPEEKARATTPRKGLREDGPLRVSFVLESGNSKTGPIPVTMTSAGTCPKSCAFYTAVHHVRHGHFHDRDGLRAWSKKRMNARTSVGTTEQVAPASLTDAITERSKIIPEIIRLQALLSGTDPQQIVSSSFAYKRERAGLVAQCTKLQQRAGFLRRWIASKSISGTPGISPQIHALAIAYRLLTKIQEEDTGSPFSEDIDSCLQQLELFIPISLVNEEAKTG